MKKIAAMVITMMLIISPNVFAHSGRTDANGGHFNRKTGEYHYHNGGSSGSSGDDYESSYTPSSKITIPKAPKSMKVGDSVSVDWDVDGISNYRYSTWSSSNERVVSVSSDGVLTAHSAGTAKISVSYDSTTKSWNVKVSPILVDGIELEQDRILLYVGESVNLTAKITPFNATNDSITWKSDNKSIAIADESGMISAVDSGIAIITATTDDGSRKSAKATVYVLADIPEENYPIGKDNDRSDITTVQVMLISIGELKGKADGVYGPKTDAAILHFSASEGLEADACSYDLYSAMLGKVALQFK